MIHTHINKDTNNDILTQWQINKLTNTVSSACAYNDTDIYNDTYKNIPKSNEQKQYYKIEFWFCSALVKEKIYIIQNIDILCLK